MDLQAQVQMVNAAHQSLLAEVVKLRALKRGSFSEGSVAYDGVLSLTSLCEVSEPIKPDFFPEAGIPVHLFGDRKMLARFCLTYLFSQFPVISGYNVVEVGVEGGTFSSFLSDLFPECAINLFDITYEHFDPRNNRGNMIFYQGDSAQKLADISCDSCIYAYIDGGHDYDSVSRDIRSISSKMKHGSVLQFNDYASFSPMGGFPYGVRRAVNELINSGRVSLIGYSLNAHGYDDIALRWL